VSKAVGYSSPRRQVAVSVPVPAPTGGLNKRDSLAQMPVTDAYELDNWFPKTDGVETRFGYASFATGMVTSVKTLAVYEGGGTQQLLAFANNSMFNVTAGGAVGAAVVAGRSSDSVVTCMFANAATQFLYIVDGASNPATYDGTNYVDRVITNASLSADNNLVYVHNFKQRLLFAAINECAFYFLPVSAIAGAASRFDLGEIAQTGGSLSAIASITRDGGAGPDDYVAFILSTGEIIVYQGTDPSSAATWGLVGRYRTAKPIGRNCCIKYGGDVILITEIGLVALTQLFDGREYDEQLDPVSNKIGKAFDPYLTFADRTGWQACIFGPGSKLIFNLPLSSSGSYQQFVMNTTTKAWCRFTGMDALCWAVLGRRLFFGAAGGIVYEAETGESDNGDPIEPSCKQAFSYFDIPEVKHFLTAKLMFQFSGTPPVITGFNVNYADDAQLFSDSNTSSDGTGGEWNTSPWNTTGWSRESNVQIYYMEINKIGTSGSIWFKASSSSAQLKWFASEVILRKGGLV
jgi:hypothetical protein